MRSVRRSSPKAKAALSFWRPWPGMSTTRSRGSDISAVARWWGSRRTRIIVSERVGGGCFCSASALRRSSPMTRIVCGLPGATSASSCLTCGSIGVVLRLKIVDPLVDLEQHGGGDGGGAQAGDDHAREHEALVHPPRQARGPFLGFAAHYLPPKRLSDRAIASICVLVKVSRGCSRPSRRRAACSRTPGAGGCHRRTACTCDRAIRIVSDESSRIGGDFQVMPCTP